MPITQSPAPAPQHTHRRASDDDEASVALPPTRTCRRRMRRYWAAVRAAAWVPRPNASEETAQNAHLCLVGVCKQAWPPAITASGDSNPNPNPNPNPNSNHCAPLPGGAPPPGCAGRPEQPAGAHHIHRGELSRGGCHNRWHSLADRDSIMATHLPRRWPRAASRRRPRPPARTGPASTPSTCGTPRQWLRFSYIYVHFIFGSYQDDKKTEP
eukprot:COSAG01_NODE_8913_length_2616_cov_1.720699_2_plen_212_part_00